jgi:hypothetical protein
MPPTAASLVPARTGARKLLLILMLAALAMLAGRRAAVTGDFVEYLQMTVSIASHGSADVRAEDVAAMRTLLTSELTEHLDRLDAFRRDPRHAPVLPGFYPGRDDKIYAIHFPAYSALAAIPFKLFQWTGIPPLKCYQAANLSVLLVLGMAMLRLFNGDTLRAGAGVALYMACGGYLYWNWSGPEFVSAAALLAGLAWYCSGAPLLGGALVGVAAMQNPSIIITLGVLPVLAWCLQPGVSLRQGVLDALRLRTLAGLLPGGALAAAPVLFNLWQFGKPSIIAYVSTATDTIGLGRLHSLFFDLNQGMILAIPAVAAMLLLWGWRAMAAPQRRCRALALLLCTLLTVAYAVPAMTVHNWNSGAAGVMRYAFWSATPFVFLLLWQLRGLQRWPRVLLGAAFALQAAAMAAGGTYSSVELSPVAKFVLKHMPRLYNPEPEIFAERVSGRDDFHADLSRVYVLRDGSTILKALNHHTNPDPGQKLCRAGETLAGSGKSRRRGDWIYLDGPVHCLLRTAVPVEQFAAGPYVAAGQGWSVLEQQPGFPGGRWSEGAVSRLTVAYARPGMHQQIAFRGKYFDGNRRTRVVINGVDMGKFNLQAGEPVAIPQAAATSGLQIELHHESPRSPGPADGRKVALFLEQVSLR